MKKIIGLILGLIILLSTTFVYAIDYANALEYIDKRVVLYILFDDTIKEVEAYIINVVANYEVHVDNPIGGVFAGDYFLAKVYNKTVLVPLKYVMGVELK